MKYKLYGVNCSFNSREDLFSYLLNLPDRFQRQIENVTVMEYTAGWKYIQSYSIHIKDGNVTLAKIGRNKKKEGETPRYYITDRYFLNDLPTARKKQRTMIKNEITDHLLCDEKGFYILKVFPNKKEKKIR